MICQKVLSGKRRAIRGSRRTSAIIRNMTRPRKASMAVTRLGGASRVDFIAGSDLSFVLVPKLRSILVPKLRSILVPKLRLGTHLPETPFRILQVVRNRVSRTWRSQIEFGNEKEGRKISLGVAKSFRSPPQAEGGVRDIENLFAVGQRVPAVAKAIRRVTLLSGFQVAVAVAGGLDLRPRQMAGTVSDREAALGGAVNQMSR